MHLDTYELILSELDKVIDSIEVYILINVLVPWTFIQGHKVARKLKLLHQLCHKFLNQLSQISQSVCRNVCDSLLCREDNCKDVM